MLAAKGGRERLHSIQSVIRSSRTPAKLRGRSYTRQVEFLFVFPNRFWYWDDERPSVLGLATKSVNFETKRAYSMVEQEQSPVLGAAQPAEFWRLEMIQAAELLETQWVHLQPKRTWREASKKDKMASIFVECRFPMLMGWATATFTVDSKTFLPKQVVIDYPLPTDSRATDGFEFFDYVDVSGIQMPSAVRNFGVLTYKETVHYQFNVDYDPAIFERGSRIQDGPEGWRRQN